jgi:hypothetical protein
MPTATNNHTTPTRRTALGFSAAAFVAGLTTPTLARGVPLSPDAELIRLGRALDTAAARTAEAYAITAGEDTEEAEAFVDSVNKTALDIVERIELLRATTLEGLKVKHQALCWCWCGDPLTAEALADHPQPCADMRLLAGLLDDLSAMGSAAA